MNNLTEDDVRWMLNTLGWLSDRDSDGGITTCQYHRGHGFQSDCAICRKTKEIESKLDRQTMPVREIFTPLPQDEADAIRNFMP